MTRRGAPPDHRQAQFPLDDFYVVPQPPAPAAGSLAFGPELRAVLSDELSTARVNLGLSREAVAAQMGELCAHPISSAALNACTAESHEAQGHRFPLEWLPAFEQTCRTHALQLLIARKRGSLVLIGKEARDAQLGLVRRRIEELREQEKKLLGQLKKDRA